MDLNNDVKFPYSASEIREAIDEMAKEIGHPLTTEEKLVLETAKKANPKYFAAVIDAAGVMKDRREKYSGADPYENFALMEYVMSVYMEHKYGHKVDRRDVLMYYHSQKYCRMLVSGSTDFKDESGKDTRRDGANYLLIDEGDMLDAS